MLLLTTISKGLTIVIDEPWRTESDGSKDKNGKKKSVVLDNRGNVVFQIQKKKHKRNIVGLVIGNDSSIAVSKTPSIHHIRCASISF